MNGDGYPDIVYKDAMQLSNSTGGLGGLNPNSPAVLQAPFTNAYLSNTDSYSNNLSASYDYSKFKSVGTKYSFTPDPNAPCQSLQTTTDSSSSWSTGMSLSPNFDSKDSGESYWMDVNGDGLPDRITGGGTANMKYALNVGNHLLGSVSFNGLETYSSKPIGSVGLSFGVGSFSDVVNNAGAATSGVSGSGSISASASFGTGKNTYEDINGDGLVDILNIYSDYTEVRYNLGNKFAASQRLYKTAGNIDYNNEAKTYSGALSLHGHFYFHFGWLIYFKFGAAIDANFGAKISEVDKAFKDMNGDGFPDMVVSNSNGFKVNYSTIGRTNKLKTVTQEYTRKEITSQFEIDYEFTKPTYNDPHAKLVMKEVKLINPDAFSGNYLISDASKDIVTQFKYENSRYDRRERDNFGFETVITNQMDGNTVFRSNKQTFFNNGYLMSGLPRISSSYDTSGNLLSSSTNNYVLRKFTSTTSAFNTAIDLSVALPENFDTGGKEGRKMARVFLANTQSTVYDTGGQISTETFFEYNESGQIRKYTYTSPASSYNSVIGYHSTNLNTNIQGIPKSIDVYQGSSTNTLRHRETQINNLGEVSKIIVKLNNTENAETNFTYDSYGNLSTVTSPNNYKLTYNYDTTLNKYVANTQDSFNVTSSALYDPLFDAVLEATDTSGNKMKYSYDAKGRIKSILAPKEVGISPYTVNYEYFVVPVLPNNNNIQPALFGAKTKNFDPQHPTNPIETISFVDYLGRVVQVKKDIEESGIEKMSISGRVVYDIHGRAKQQYHPLSEAKDNLNSFTLINDFLNLSLSNYFTTAEYDNRDRPISTTNEDNNTTTTKFAIENNGFKTTVEQDQNAAQVPLKSESFANADGKTLSSSNYVNNTALTTYFDYNPIGELTTVTDPEGIQTSYDYDLAGRRTSVNHPDHGITSYQYNTAGQLIRLTTANLINDPSIQTHHIDYKYDYNRLIGIYLPNLPNGNLNPNNVSYTFGNAGSGNSTGKLVRKNDGSGSTTYTYGNMGEVISQYKRVSGYNIPTMDFTTGFQYDSWNRVNKIIYNDGEKVNYAYDLGGNLQSMQGQDNYINKISYDEYEQRKSIEYGNGTSSTFSYNPTNRMLNSHTLTQIYGNNILENNYDFDFVGNITGISSSAPQSKNDMGGNYNFGYSYDQLNRLSSASGSFGIISDRELNAISYQTSPYAVSNADFTLDLEYNASSGIMNKRQEHNQDQHPNAGNTYNNTYRYKAETHMVEVVVDQNTGNWNNFKYDFNGNVIASITENDEERMYWDEQDRLKAFSKYSTGIYQYYVYDDSGERIIKYMLKDQADLYQNGALVDPGNMQLYDYTVYPSPYEVVAGNGTLSKHYFAGSQRIASRIEEKDPFMKTSSALKPTEKERSTIAEDDFNTYLKKAQLEGKKVDTEFAKAPSGTAGLYYLHGDHLGTASYVTDGNGETTQFFLNLPFGETMAEQNLPGAYENPYKFNAKELDRETNLYYYGARYYNPRLSIWYGVDPLAEKYPSLSPYVYTVNNPIKYIDPDGRDIVIVTDRDGASGNGHGAVIIGSEKTGWRYVSENGTGEGAKPFGRNVNPDLGNKIGNGQNQWKAGTSLQTVLEKIQDTNPKEKHDYTSYSRIETSPLEDQMAYDAAFKQASMQQKSYLTFPAPPVEAGYSIFGSSCIDVPQEALMAVVHSRMGESLSYYEEYKWGFDDLKPNIWHAKIQIYLDRINKDRRVRNNETFKLKGYKGDVPGGSERREKEKNAPKFKLP